MKLLKVLSLSTASLAMSVATIQMALLMETGGCSEPCTKSSFTWGWALIRTIHLVFTVPYVTATRVIWVNKG